MSTVRIIFADLNKHELLMYREDGQKIIVLQGDPRIADLVAKVFPDMDKQNFCDLPETMLDKHNTYDVAEKKMNGFVRFFKLAKAKFDEIIGNHKEPEVLPPQKAGDVGALNAILNPPKVKLDADQAPLTRSEKAVAEIMAHAKPASHESFTEEPKASESTIAVLGDGTVIENADKLRVQLEAVNSGLANEIGLKNFLNRMATVKRAHSAQDLLTFMEKGELPIADDGTVLVYKRLRSTSKEGVFVDCHTRKVEQKVGSFVCMDASLVDPSRHNECSNGLHVARRDYLNSFAGDVCVLAKLAPEDVIAVPHGDPRKLRARGYHIIAVLSKEDHDRVISDKPLKDESLLGNAVAGNHVGILETVQITKQQGGGVIITPAKGVAEFKADATLNSKSLDNLAESPKASVDAVAVAKNQQKAKEDPVFTEPEETASAFEEPAKVANTKPMTKLEVLVTDFTGAAKGSVTEHTAALALVAHKKAVKKSWTALGIPVSVFDRASALAAQAYVSPVKDKPKPVKAGKKASVAVAPAKAKSKPAVKATRNIGPVSKVTDKPTETVQQLAARAIKNKSQALAMQAFEAKKAKKKSWDALGVAASDVATLTSLAGK